MQSLVICSSAADLAIAREIRCYIEANCPSVRMQDETVIPSANELIDTVGGALSDDFTLLLLSPDSIPSVWSRQQWEPALIEQPRKLGAALAFVLVRPCRFPEVLRKLRFFDLCGSPLAGLRKLRQWLLERNPMKRERIDLLPPCPRTSGSPLESIADLEDSILDRPGACFEVPRETALAFTYSHIHAFDGVFWVDCRGRSQVGVLGDTAHAVGLKLRGPAAENVAALHEFCAGLRCLFVFDALAPGDRELLSFKGRASVIFTRASGEHARGLSLTETVQLFAHWRSDPEQCLRHLGDAERHLRALESDCSKERTLAAGTLGTYAFGLLRQQDRLAEAYDVLQFLSKLAWDEGNRTDLRRWEWEKSWIRESWGQLPSAALRLGAASEPVQMELGF